MTATTDSQQELSEPAIAEGSDTEVAKVSAVEVTEASSEPSSESQATKGAKSSKEAEPAKERPRRESIALEVKAQRCEETAKRLVGYLGVESSELAVTIDGEQCTVASQTVMCMPGFVDDGTGRCECPPK